jgi:hypothetical protein
MFVPPETSMSGFVFPGAADPTELHRSSEPLATPDSLTFHLMNGLFSGAAARAALRSAHASLDELTVSVGAHGLQAAAASPGLTSAVDQHAAGVRDSLSADTRPMNAIILAAYGEGVRDAALKHGWVPPHGEIDWTRNDWVLVRLLAVCRLAQALPDDR